MCLGLGNTASVGLWIQRTRNPAGELMQVGIADPGGGPDAGGHSRRSRVHVHLGIAAKCTDTRAPAKDGRIHSN